MVMIMEMTIRMTNLTFMLCSMAFLFESKSDSVPIHSPQ